MISTYPTDLEENITSVVGICGSLRNGSYTRQALSIALKGAEEAGARARMIDLRDYRLPFCGQEDDVEGREGVARLRLDVAQAQGVILGTPEYHGSFSGVLKNALDFLSMTEMRGKVVGLIGVAGGTMGANNALNDLRSVNRALHAWVVPDQASIAEVHRAFDKSGQLNDPKLTARLKGVGREVARFAYLHSSKQALEFLKAWEETALAEVGQ